MSNLKFKKQLRQIKKNRKVEEISTSYKMVFRGFGLTKEQVKWNEQDESTLKSLIPSINEIKKLLKKE